MFSFLRMDTAPVRSPPFMLLVLCEVLVARTTLGRRVLRPSLRRLVALYCLDRLRPFGQPLLAVPAWVLVLPRQFLSSMPPFV